MNRNFFARLLIVAKSLEIDIATASGSLVKTAKHKLFHILESKGGNDEVDIKGKSIQINLHPIGTVSENIMWRKL